MSALLETIKRQQAAADPLQSAFVSANAGAGKTRVLTNRVARLLLADAPPDRILCITFTKAAAAEMASRLFGMLGAWALAEDDALIAALGDLEGSHAAVRSEAALAKARRLFARALETPGGLKIQTIHSFCESVLRRFPLEAGLPPGFIVLEEADAQTLKRAALSDIAMRARDDAALSDMINRLSALRFKGDIRSALMSTRTDDLDADKLANQLRSALEISDEIDEGTLRDAFLSKIDARRWDGICAAMVEGGSNAKKFVAAPMAAYGRSETVDERWAALQALFLTTTGEPRKKFGDKKTEDAAPGANDYLLSLQRDFVACNDMLATIALYRTSADFVSLKAAFADAYAEQKRRHAAVDFDDLIRLTDRLMRNVDAAWVSYKLDQGVDHILVDEAQDTSPAQWSVIESLLSELVSGEGASARPRSFFAVGDLKQSIYSFQGADAGLFLEKEQELGERLSAVKRYENVRLALSFRTTAPVLQFVDNVFGDVEAAQGLGEFPIPAHGVKRAGEGGLVELWPLTPRPEVEFENPWDAPVDDTAPNDPARRLCERVAATIRGWIDNEEILASKGRPVRCDDIMILVQSRSRLFHEMIGRLGAFGVPVAGADRLTLTEDPAVEDLIAYARAVTTPDDDLSFAALLKSPFFGVDEEALFDLAYARGDGVSLQSNLYRRKDETPHWRAVAAEFEIARAVGARQGPVAFFSHILEVGDPSGRERLYARLGETAADTINALLQLAHQYELSAPRSLFNFIHWFEKNAGDVKREMDQAEGAVRIMTVHGSKGLEANIVFLLDAHRLANTRDLGPVLRLGADPGARGGAPLVFAAGDGAASPAAIAARDHAKKDSYEEYRRLFYVASTRARDRLYICGLEQGNQRAPRDRPTAEKSWHALAHDAFDRLEDASAAAQPGFWDEDGEPIRRIICSQTASIDEETSKEPEALEPLPDWARQAPSREAPRVRLAPSQYLGEDDAFLDQLSAPGAAPVFSPLQDDRYFRGRIIHDLLEWLPQISAEFQAEEADRFLAMRAEGAPALERATWRDEVLAVLNDPEFAHVFGANSRAEISIGARLDGPHGCVDISGRIDRLVVGDQAVLAVDYKSNRPPPERVEDTPEAYLQQMTLYRAALQKIYPDLEIKTALLWTYAPRLMPIPDALLDHAFARALQ